MNAVETQAGTVFGTPRYMSPEQAQAKPLDARSDLYSLGVILYHMLAGRPPFTDDDAIIVMARHIKSQPKPFSDVCPEAHIPSEVEKIVFRTMAKDPANRPANADEMAQELVAAFEHSRASASGVRSAAVRSGSVRPPPMASTPPPAPAQAADSLEVRPPTATKQLPRSFVAFAAAVGVIAVVVVAALAVRVLREPARPPIVINSTPPTTTRPAPTATATDTGTAKPPATASTDVPTLEVTALPSAKGPAPIRTGHKPLGTPAPGASSAGDRYGHLE